MLVVLPLLWAPVAQADQLWRDLSGPEIRAALTDSQIRYDAAWQRFYASGRTLYNAGRDSWGYWRVDQGSYCSMWPPSDLWSCYQVEASGQMVRFVGQAGDVTTGIITHD